MLFIFVLLFELLPSSLAEDRSLYGDISADFQALSLTQQRREHLCQRELPAIFFQTEKDEPVRGNGSTIFYHRIDVCCEGYKWAVNQPHHCVPDCGNSSPDNCRNGFCRSPGRCECFAEFVLNYRGACVHTCPIACEHGQCYLNGTCVCRTGYQLDAETQRFCRPICPQTCPTYQECVAPGKCACIAGYRQTPDMGCQPICTPDCGYGMCVGPNECECFAGYMKRPQRNVCEAECYINCDNGFCESRYKCQCREGFRFDAATSSCLPQCEENCSQGNGVCIAPGVCRCFEGYQLQGNGCEPICQGGCGRYGICLAPGICGCGPGRQLCQGGNCEANGHCLCPKGTTHFVDRCTTSQWVEFGERDRDDRSHYSKQLGYEFHALIGRLFILQSHK